MDKEHIKEVMRATKALGNMIGASLYQHACQTCQRSYWVFRKPENKDQGIEKCCACRYGKEVEESFVTKVFCRW